MGVEYWWNDPDRTSTNARGGGCPRVALCTTNPRWAGLGLKLGLRSKRPTTNLLSHDAAVQNLVPNISNMSLFRIN
jgi:hypothetical protein